MSDPYWNNVVLLISFDNENGATAFADKSSKSHTLTTVPSAHSDTAQKKFGTASLNPGSGRIDLSDSTDWSFGTSDFTIEGWIYPTGLGSPFLNCQANNNAFIPIFLGSATTAAVYANGSIIIN
jgi:hypothetical protein